MEPETKDSGPGHKDLLRVAGFLLGFFPAAIIPSAWDRPIIDGLTGLILRLRPNKEPLLAQRMAESVGRVEEAIDLRAEARHRYQHYLEAPWARVRALHRNGWKPDIEVEGLEHIRASQEVGKGTILWRVSMGTSLTAKKALSDAGIELIHLSADTHGSWSDTWLAEKALAPLYRRTEGWWVKERVIIPADRAMAGIMKTLIKHLRSNAVVSIFGDLRAAQNVYATVLGQTAVFATGSPSLAFKTGATLLPVYSVRQGTGRFRIIVDEPIVPDRNLGRKEYVQEAVQEFARRIDEIVREHPGSWSKWVNFWNHEGSFSPMPGLAVGGSGHAET
jgi:lauroyl/myristoyl acyltransferase